MKRIGRRLLWAGVVLALVTGCNQLGCITSSPDPVVKDPPASPANPQPSTDEYRQFLANLFYDKNTATWECYYPPTGEHEWMVIAEELPAADVTAVIERLDETFAQAEQPIVELSRLEDDTAIVTVTDDRLLGEGMGSAGANCYIATVTYSLTSVEGTDYVWFDITEGSHAAPGRYSRASFSNLWPLQTIE